MHYFTPIVYSAYRIPISEALAAQRRLEVLLIFKLDWEYSKLCGFVWARVSLSVVRYNSLLVCNLWYKKERIRQQPEMMDDAVVALLAPWQG